MVGGIQQDASERWAHVLIHQVDTHQVAHALATAHVQRKKRATQLGQHLQKLLLLLLKTNLSLLRIRRSLHFLQKRRRQSIWQSKMLSARVRSTLVFVCVIAATSEKTAVALARQRAETFI